MFYLGPTRCAAPAANFSPEPCQTQPFPVFAMAGPTKREWSTPWAAQLLAPRHVRCLWHIRSIALLILGDQAHQQCNVFLCLGNRPLKSYMFGLPLTSKSKGRTPENRSTLRSKLRCTRFSRKFGVHWAPCQQNDPNRGGLGVAH